MLIRLASAALLLLAITIGASAQQGAPGLPVANFQFWDVHALDTPQGKVCFVASRPNRSLPEGVRRSEILFMLSRRPFEAVMNEAYAQMGYPLAPDSEVLVTVDGNETFTMFISEEGAWLQSEVEDNLLAAAMRRGREMVVRGRSARGTDTTDTYSLAGVSAALDRMATECPT